MEKQKLSWPVKPTYRKTNPQDEASLHAHPPPSDQHHHHNTSPQQASSSRTPSHRSLPSSSRPKNKLSTKSTSNHYPKHKSTTHVSSKLSPPANSTKSSPANPNKSSVNSSKSTLNSNKPTSSKIDVLVRSSSLSQMHLPTTNPPPSTQYHYLQSRLQRKPNPRPTSPPSSFYSTSSSASSSSSNIDLFAGPRTSIHLDPLTGQLLSAGNDVTAMDALIDTLKDPSSLSPHRSTARKKNHHRTKPPSHPSSKPPSRTSQKSQLRFPSSPSSSSLVASTSTSNTGLESARSRSAVDLSTRTQQPAVLQHLRRTKPKHDHTNTQLNHHLQPPTTATLSSHSRHPSPPLPLPTPPPPPSIAIPSINGIIEKYSKQINYSTNHPPRQSPQLKIDSIDEIVEKYNPILKRSTRLEPNHHINSNTQSDPKHLSPLQDHILTGSSTRHRSLSENSDDSHSSINSLTREALALQALLSNEAERDSHSSPHTCSSPLGSPGIQPSGDADSISKRSSSPVCRAPPKQSSTTATTEDRPLQTQVDEQIALYLRSTRLTTLIKLQRQQSPMTVSLADVGSSTGHPVFVFLGLGCVRYLVGLYDELAEALGLRLICIDRWGLGKTTEVPDEQRGFLEWASVVEEVADQLEIQKFSILAHSAGAPYALACSLRFGDRVHGSIHLLAPWVSMTAEGGINAGAYKWLKYIPNSMIKTVQAAEWKMTGWRLGKPPSLNHPPVGFDARAPVGSQPSPPLLELHEEDYPSQRRDDEKNELDDSKSHSSSQALSPGSKRGRTMDEVGQSLKSQMSADSTQVDQDSQSIGTASSLGRSRNMSRLNSSTSQLSHNNNGSSNHHNKGGFIGKIFPSQSPSIGGASSSSPNHAKSLDPLPFDPKASLGRRASSSIGASGEDDTDDKNFYRKDYFDSIGTKKLSLKNKSSASESKSPIHSKKPEDLVEDGGRRGHMMAHQSSSQGSSHQQQTGSPNKEERRTRVGGTTSGSSKEVMEEGKRKNRVRRSLGISLLRASYSESLRGGTSDLITILEKNSKPWGFSYAEISKPVKIWHGDKDERLSPKGSQWFINSITSPSVKNNSALFIVQNATHSLMTDVSVLYQVFESIADQRPSPSSSSSL